jgi:hypothetical protein
MAVRFFGALVLHRDAEAMLELLPDVFPWVTFLPEPSHRTFLDEFVLTLRAALDIDNFAPVAQLITEWKHTAEVYADPTLLAVLTRPADDFGPVPAPPAA